MSAAHTPGPWYWVGDSLEGDRDYVLGVGDDGKSFGLHSAVLIESDFASRAKANRILIAESPELLDMVGKLMRIIEEYVPDLEDVGDYQMAVALLAKIDGGAA